MAQGPKPAMLCANQWILEKNVFMSIKWYYKQIRIVLQRGQWLTNKTNALIAFMKPISTSSENKLEWGGSPNNFCIWGWVSPNHLILQFLKLLNSDKMCSTMKYVLRVWQIGSGLVSVQCSLGISQAEICPFELLA